MAISIKDIKPCYLVVVRFSNHGGVSYTRVSETQLEGDHAKQEKVERVSRKVCEDPEEHKTAVALRGKLLRELSNIGVSSPVGWIIALDKIEEATNLHLSYRDQVHDFNKEATYTKIRFAMDTFRIQGENEATLKNMMADMRDVLDDLKDATDKADYKSMREVVRRMKGWETVLPEDKSIQVTALINETRAQAKQIRRALEVQKRSLGDVQKEIADTNLVNLTRFALIETDTEEPEESSSNEALSARMELQLSLVNTSNEENEEEEDAVTSKDFIALRNAQLSSINSVDSE